MRVMEKIRAFLARESVLVVSCVVALLSCLIVPPDGVYLSYIDWHTIILLFCLMAVVTGLRFLGVIRVLGEWVISHVRSQAMLASALVALPFFCSMFITNDVALITFVPFALVVLHKARLDAMMGPVVALMTIAANLGSMLFPMGNPQNLYLFQLSGMDVGSFVCLMAPYTASVAVALAIFLMVLFWKGKRFSSERSRLHIKADHSPFRLRRGNGTQYSLRKVICVCVYVLLFVVCLGAVGDLLNVYWVGAIVFLAVLVMDRKNLLRVDYGLLFTFIALFVFVGNMGRVPLIHDVVSQLINTMPVVASVLLSQVISNVPSALLLSGFTDQWNALIIGTNIGGLGTLIASMASIISLKLVTAEGFVKRGVYLRTFTLYNLIFLALLLVIYFGLSCAGIYV